MPLRQGKSKEVIRENAMTEIKAGRDPKQAFAIAYSEAGESRKPRRKKAARGKAKT